MSAPHPLCCCFGRVCISLCQALRYWGRRENKVKENKKENARTLGKRTVVEKRRKQASLSFPSNGVFFASIFTISAHFYLEAWNSLVCICSCANSLEVNLITKLSPVSLQLHENEYLRFLLYKRTIDCDLPINSLPRSRVCVVTQRSSPRIRTLKRSVA